jgi:hypothetical protein
LAPPRRERRRSPWRSPTRGPVSTLDRRCLLAAVDLGVARQQHGLGDGEPRIVLHAMSAPLLLLDDVGQEVEFGSPVVAHAIQYRYDRVKPILATSGLTVEQLVSRYGGGSWEA